jgi:hypothetical protein
MELHYPQQVICWPDGSIDVTDSREGYHYYIVGCPGNRTVVGVHEQDYLFDPDFWHHHWPFTGPTKPDGR